MWITVSINMRVRLKDASLCVCVCVFNWMGTGLGVCGGVESLRRLYFASAVPLLRLWKLVPPTLTTLSSTSQPPYMFPA